MLWAHGHDGYFTITQKLSQWNHDSKNRNNTAANKSQNRLGWNSQQASLTTTRPVHLIVLRLDLPWFCAPPFLWFITTEFFYITAFNKTLAHVCKLKCHHMHYILVIYSTYIHTGVHENLKWIKIMCLVSLLLVSFVEFPIFKSNNFFYKYHTEN